MVALNNEGRWIELENLGKVIKRNVNKTKRQQQKAKVARRKPVQRKKRASKIKRRTARIVKKKVQGSLGKTHFKRSIKKKTHRKMNLVGVKVKRKINPKIKRKRVRPSHSQDEKLGRTATKKPLNEALRDLNRELRILLKAKNNLESSDKDVAGQMTKMQAKELQLRAEISKLMRSLSVLDKKEGSIKDKILGVDKQIDKVKAIRREMEEV